MEYYFEMQYQKTLIIALVVVVCIIVAIVWGGISVVVRKIKRKRSLKSKNRT